MELPVILTPSEDGYVVAECPVIPPIISGRECIGVLTKLGYCKLRQQESRVRLVCKG